jgi:hypothetical protein
MDEIDEISNSQAQMVKKPLKHLAALGEKEHLIRLGTSMAACGDWW